MTQKVLGTLGVAASITAAVGLLTNDGWPGYVIGALLAVVLWLMLFFGEMGISVAAARVRISVYAPAAVVSVALGYLIFRVGDQNATFWATGFIIAGVIWPATRLAVSDDGAS